MLVAIAVLAAMVGCSQDEARDVAKEAGRTVATNAARAADRVTDLATSAGVTLRDISYRPERLVVKIGKTVKWTNRDDFAHTVTSDNEVFNSGDLGTDKEFSFRFTQKGDYAYHCEIHGKARMSGVVVVE